MDGFGPGVVDNTLQGSQGALTRLFVTQEPGC